MTAGQVGHRFAELVARSDDDIPLDEAALLIAAGAYPGLRRRRAAGASRRAGRRLPEPTLEGLRRHLFDDVGFTGNAVRYNDPRNSFLKAVLLLVAAPPRAILTRMLTNLPPLRPGGRCCVARVGDAAAGHHSTW